LISKYDGLDNGHLKAPCIDFLLLCLSSPVKLLSKTTVATMKSGAFLASFVMLYQYQICGHRNLVKAGVTTFNSKYLYWLAGFICSYISIFFEDKRRRTELALYVLPKALKSFYEICYQRKWIIRIKHFEVAMASFAMGVIMVSLLLAPSYKCNIIATMF
jgi:hypothetical protein